MSITAGPPHKNSKKSYHRRHNSDDELDVFEAARYFSGANYEVSGSHQKISRSGGRISLDIPVTRNSNTHKVDQVMLEKTTKEKKLYKQPTSPGGRLATFLNSLFSQNTSKKKKSKSCSAQSIKDEDHERRKRRSSISHFRSSNTTSNISSSADNSKSSVYSSSSSGFRTPPNYYTKNSYMDLRKFIDHNKPQALQVPTLSKNNSHVTSQKEDIRKMSTDEDNASWLGDDKFKFSTTTCNSNNKGLSSEKFVGYQSTEKDFTNFINEMDDGAYSDSSSDLFELQNYDLGCYSSGLPVYETTHMDNIKRGATLTSYAV